MKSLTLILSFLLVASLSFANTGETTGESSPQAGAEPIEQQELSLEEQKAHLSNVLEQHKDKLGEKKTAKLEQVLNKQLEKQHKQIEKISDAKSETKAAKIKKQLEKREAKIAKAAQGNSSYVRLGVILSLAGIVIALLLSYQLGIILLAIGIILIIVGIV